MCTFKYNLFFRLPDEALGLVTTSAENTRAIPLKSPKPRITQPSVRLYPTNSNDVETMLEPNDGCVADLQDVGKFNEVSINLCSIAVMF